MCLFIYSIYNYVQYVCRPMCTYDRFLCLSHGVQQDRLHPSVKLQLIHVCLQTDQNALLPAEPLLQFGPGVLECSDPTQTKGNQRTKKARHAEREKIYNNVVVVLSVLSVYFIL